MLKFLLLAALLIGSTNSFAALVQCTPASADFLNTTGGVTTGVASPFTCAPSGIAGNISFDGLDVIAIRIVVSATAQIAGGIPSLSYTATATMTNNASLANPGPMPFSCTTDGLGACVSAPPSVSATTGVGPIDEFASFIVTVAGTPGSPLSLSNGTAAVFYEATTRPHDTGVPEPATFAMMGLGLIAAVAFSRRK